MPRACHTEAMKTYYVCRQLKGGNPDGWFVEARSPDDRPVNKGKYVSEAEARAAAKSLQAIEAKPPK
jgi:hypothetical protein